MPSIRGHKWQALAGLLPESDRRCNVQCIKGPDLREDNESLCLLDYPRIWLDKLPVSAVLSNTGEHAGETLLRDLTRDPRIKELGHSISYLIRQMGKLPIDLRLNTEVTEATLDTYAPDAVILATGARPLMPDVPGIDSISGRSVSFRSQANAR